MENRTTARNLCWLNGTPSGTIGADCRGLHYGDGHFTTMALRNGVTELWPLHKQRLTEACRRLAMQQPDWQSVEALLRQVAAQHASGVLKLSLFRGAGGRGYSAVGCGATEWLLSLSPLPSFIARWRSEGIRLGLCEGRLAANPRLAGLKHLNRLEQVLLRQEIDRHGWDEGLICDYDGNLIEACSANLLWLHQGQWYTPDLSQCGVAGVMREYLTQQLASRDQTLQIVRADCSILHQVSAIAICNSLIGIVPVVQVGDYRYDPAPVHHLVSWLSESFLG